MFKRDLINEEDFQKVRFLLSFQPELVKYKLQSYTRKICNEEVLAKSLKSFQTTVSKEFKKQEESKSTYIQTKSLKSASHTMQISNSPTLANRSKLSYLTNTDKPIKDHLISPGKGDLKNILGTGPKKEAVSRSSIKTNSSVLCTPLNDKSRSKKIGTQLEDIKEEMYELDDTVREELLRIIEAKDTSLIAKGMAKFYIGIERLTSNNLIKFPSKPLKKDLSNIIPLVEEKLHKVISEIFHQGYEDLHSIYPEKMTQYEEELAENGEVLRFLNDIETNLVISNLDNYGKSNVTMVRNN